MQRVLYQICQDVETGIWQIRPTDAPGFLHEAPDMPTVLRKAADALDPKNKLCPIMSPAENVAFCQGDGCRLWNADLGTCNLAVQGYLAGLEVARAERGSKSESERD